MNISTHQKYLITFFSSSSKTVCVWMRASLGPQNNHLFRKYSVKFIRKFCLMMWIIKLRVCANENKPILFFDMHSMFHHFTNSFWIYNFSCFFFLLARSNWTPIFFIFDCCHNFFSVGANSIMKGLRHL